MKPIPAMKLIALISRLALVGFASFILGVALDTLPLALFAFAASALVLLVVVGDYAPRTFCGQSRPADIVPFAPAPVRVEAPAKRAA